MVASCDCSSTSETRNFEELSFCWKNSDWLLSSSIQSFNFPDSSLCHLFFIRKLKASPPPPTPPPVPCSGSESKICKDLACPEASLGDWYSPPSTLTVTWSHPSSSSSFLHLQQQQRNREASFSSSANYNFCGNRIRGLASRALMLQNLEFSRN